jgi:hypothetical protein
MPKNFPGTGSKDIYIKKTYVPKTLDCVQNLLTILNSTINITGDAEELYDHVMSTKTFALIMTKIFIRALNSMRKVPTYSLDLGFG